MISKKIVILGFCSFLIIGCSNSKDNHVIEQLKVENDSLNKILNELNQKYIFDNISIRDIPSYKNTYDKNTEVSGEIVIVGFNNNEKSNVILADSISYNPDIKLYNPDTLQMKNGGFVYKKKLVDSLNLKGIIKFGNTHGRSHKTNYSTVIKSK